MDFILSDRNTKEDIKYITDSSAILSLQPASFKMKGGTRQQFGFIAQDIEKTALENIVYKNNQDIRSVAYNQIIPLLVHQIQILAKRVADLEGKS